MNLSNMVGQVLKEMISARGLTYTVYAEKAGVTQGYISQVVNGDIKGVKLETLEKLVKPLEITVSDFLREVEKKKAFINSVETITDRGGRDDPRLSADRHDCAHPVLVGGGSVCLDGRRRVCSRRQGQRRPFPACPAGRRARVRALPRRVSGRWRIDSACRRHADRRRRRRVHRGASADIIEPPRLIFARVRSSPASAMICRRQGLLATPRTSARVLRPTAARMR